MQEFPSSNAQRKYIFIQKESCQWFYVDSESFTVKNAASDFLHFNKILTASICKNERYLPRNLLVSAKVKENESLRIWKPILNLN